MNGYKLWWGLTVGFIFGFFVAVAVYIIPKNQIIARLEAERDLLRVELAKKWPPDTLKHKPMKREENFFPND